MTVEYKINLYERSHMYGLPHIQQLLYVLAIRPYMDYSTGVVGVMRGVSYKSFQEELYVEPHPGYKIEPLSREQLRRAVKGLQRAGLVEIISTAKRLIIKCLQATQDIFSKIKGDIKPTSQPAKKVYAKKPNVPPNIKTRPPQADITNPCKADTPPGSGNYDYVLREFDKFWNTYPVKQSRQKAFFAFTNINPDPSLMEIIMNSLEQQIACYERAKKLGKWMPSWKNPDNWLNECCWEDEINVEEDVTYASNKKPYQKQLSGIELMWQSCQTDHDSARDEEYSYEGSEQA